MNHQHWSPKDPVLSSLLLRGGLAVLVLLAWLVATAHTQEQSQPDTSDAGSSMHVKHVLGFEGAKRNDSGELSIQDDALRFLRDGSPATQVGITSIQNISLGEEDKQVGGVPMMLGKTAVPFGGGRVVSLFSHKKYDSLTIEYLDARGDYEQSSPQHSKNTKTIKLAGADGAPRSNWKGVHFHTMSMTSHFAENVLLLFKKGIWEQQRELARAIGKAQKEIRALADSGSGDVVDDSCGNASKEAIFTSYSQNRTQLRKIELALKRISTGEFGICAVCEGPIGLKRLQAIPWANNCIECQEQSEQGRVQ